MRIDIFTIEIMQWFVVKLGATIEGNKHVSTRVGIPFPRYSCYADGNWRGLYNRHSCTRGWILTWTGLTFRSSFSSNFFLYGISLFFSYWRDQEQREKEREIFGGPQDFGGGGWIGRETERRAAWFAIEKGTQNEREWRAIIDSIIGGCRQTSKWLDTRFQPLADWPARSSFII